MRGCHRNDGGHERHVLKHIHSNEYFQQEDGETLYWQQKQLDTDALTGMLSRYAYSRKLDEMNAMRALPKDTVVFLMDVNGWKAVSDKLGHAAGDELIAGVSRCILDVFDRYGDCYRIGGDEFVAIIQIAAARVPVLCASLRRRVASWSGKLNDGASVSYGYAEAKERPRDSIERLIGHADERMYASKARYYQAAGHDRRKPR